MSRLVHFEIHAEQPERAQKFYSDVFGWQFSKWDGPMEYWSIVTGLDSEPGINGGMIRRRGPAPIDGQAVNAFVCTLVVADLDQTMNKAVAMGGVIALPKMPIPGMGWLGYVKDTEGNILGMMQYDSKASALSNK